MAETIERIELPEATRERYLRYAMSVITSRALPDVRDGLKPVQRRILYAMEHDLGLRADARPVKSAKVVGQVMSNYHPHGDSAIYEAMVRLAQDWAMRYPLVHGWGNYGAITGDDAAAFRYTEARLMPLASELMAQLGEETVETRDNYDSTTREPVVLPAPVPLLLLNGSTGIAVGMATNIPPHNLGEVARAASALIDAPDTSVAQLLRTFKGPDFPTGGELLSSREELRAIYETGRGTVKLRGTYQVEEGKSPGQRVARREIVIDSVPYGTTTGQVLAKVRELIDQRKLPTVQHVSDQTNAEDGVRLVLELKPDADPAPTMAALYRLTPLETTYGINLTCLLPTASGVGRPATCDLRQMLQAWLDFRFEVVTRSLEYRKRKLEERIHILRGLATVLGALDAAIKLVRAAQDKADARAKLCKKFDLDAAQADAVLEIQLYRLAKLEVEKVQAELAEKEKEAARIARLLKGDRPRWELIKEELEDYASRYGDKRRTRINLKDDEEHAYDPTALIQEEDTHVILSRDGRLKRVRALDDPARVRLREGDELLGVLQGSTLASCAFFTNFGSAYVMRIHDVPSTSGFGEPIQKFFSFKDGERVVAGLSLDPRLTPVEEEAALLVATAAGNLLRAPLAAHRELSTRAGRRFVKLAEGDEVVAVEALRARGQDKLQVVLATSDGGALRVPLADVPVLAGVGKGKAGLSLAAKASLVGATAGPALYLETTRGAQETLDAKSVAGGELGAAPAAVKQRGGYKRALPPPPQLVELGKKE